MSLFEFLFRPLNRKRRDETVRQGEHPIDRFSQVEILAYLMLRG